jgi:hypothetical protein
MSYAFPEEKRYNKKSRKGMEINENKFAGINDLSNFAHSKIEKQQRSLSKGEMGEWLKPAVC